MGNPLPDETKWICDGCNQYVEYEEAYFPDPNQPVCYHMKCRPTEPLGELTGIVVEMDYIPNDGTPPKTLQGTLKVVADKPISAGDMVTLVTDTAPPWDSIGLVDLEADGYSEEDESYYDYSGEDEEEDD